MNSKIKIFGLIILLIGILWFIPFPNSCSWDFRNCLWGPAHVLLQGQSPYSTNMPYGNFPPSWLPMATGALFYLGWLPCVAASKIWFIGEVLGLGFVMWMVWGQTLPLPWMFLINLLIVVLFPPLYLHFLNGQFSIVFMVLMVAAIFLPKARRWRPLLLAIGLTKPQLGFIIYPGIVLAEYHEHGIMSATRLVAETAVCAVILTIPLFIAYPAWPADLVGLLFGYAGSPWDTPSLYAQLPVLLGPAGRVLWVIIFLAGLVIALRLWWTKDAKTALLWSFPLTLLITAYTWSYDFVLLLPLVLWLLRNVRQKLAKVILMTGPLLVDILIVASRWKTEISDGIQWWVPAALLVVAFCAVILDQKARTPTRYLEEPLGRTP